jgi:uncharacterized protein YecE (DUF72 family)
MDRCQLLIGTSGYSYAEWADAGFYPPGTKPSGMLPLYAQTFTITELNYTWYQMPKASAIARMCQHVPPHFHFAVKVTRNLSHEIEPDAWRSCAAQYRDGIAPLIQSDQLAAVLLQFPPSFKRVPTNRHYLAALLDEFAELPVAVEFRHTSWANDRVYDELERRRVTLVAVDEPDLKNLFPRLDVVTNPDFFYIRFHGRNARGWRSGNMQQQFNYDYTAAELREWTATRIPRMAQQARRGLIFFNNHVRAQAPHNARQLMAQLVAEGLLDG